MCGLCRLPGNYLEQLWANREEFIPEEIEDDAEARRRSARRRRPSWADEPEYKQLLRQSEEHIERGAN